MAIYLGARLMCWSTALLNIYIYIEITVNGRIGLRLIDGLEMIKIVHRAMEIDIYLL